MKKLMCALAAVAAGVAVADVTSANIVGYQNVGFATGDSLGAATLRGIATTDYKISDIRIAGEIGGFGDVCLQVFDTDGSWKSYYYLTYAGTYWLDDGWYTDLDGTPVTDEDILWKGRGFFLTSQMADVTMTFAGEVATGVQDAPYATGDSLGGNITPVDVKISELGVTGEIGGFGDVCLQVFDTDGSWKSYYYLTLAGTYWLDDGWYTDLDGTPVTDEDVLTPGAGFFMTSQMADIEITFPDPLRK